VCGKNRINYVYIRGSRGRHLESPARPASSGQAKSNARPAGCVQELPAARAAPEPLSINARPARSPFFQCRPARGPGGFKHEPPEETNRDHLFSKVVTDLVRHISLSCFLKLQLAG